MTIDSKKPNETSVCETARREIVATHGRAYAEVEIVLCEDGLHRIAVRLRYSYGGFGGPIFEDSDGYPTYQLAKEAGLAELLHHWHKPFWSEPQKVHDELNSMRQQIEDQLRQPCLL